MLVTKKSGTKLDFYFVVTFILLSAKSHSLDKSIILFDEKELNDFSKVQHWCSYIMIHFTYSFVYWVLEVQSYIHEMSYLKVLLWENEGRFDQGCVGQQGSPLTRDSGF